MIHQQCYVLGNWKMNTTLAEATALLNAAPASNLGIQVGIAPPFPWIVPLAHARTHATLWMGAQDVSPESGGAFTGDVSISMLEPYCDFVLIGHSERRIYHPEPPGAMRRKVQAVLDANRIAVLCVGESLAQRQAGNAVTIVHRQLAESLNEIAIPSDDKLLIAYEPVWAIGTGIAATSEDAESMALEIDTWIVQHLGVASGGIPILYGGSVTPENAAEIMVQPHVAGVLVGSASLNHEKFQAICHAAP